MPTKRSDVHQNGGTPILGYHLEQACRYRAELGLAVDGKLADAARSRLTSAGRQALVRSDYAAAAKLLARAASLLPTDETDRALELDLMLALSGVGKRAEALERARSLAERAAGEGDPIGERAWQIEEDFHLSFLEPEWTAERLSSLVEQSLPMFEAAGDDFALHQAYAGQFAVAQVRAHPDTGLKSLERMRAHGGRAGLAHRETGLVSAEGWFRFFGSTPLPELLSWLDEQESRGLRSPNFTAMRARALAMLGQFEKARALLSELRAELADRATTPVLLALGTAHSSVEVELVGGDPTAAMEFGLEGCQMLEEAGELSFLSTAAAMLGQALYTLGRLEEAEVQAQRAAELASDDAITEMLWRQVQAKVLARRGEHTEAERLAREAVALGEEIEIPNALADAHADLSDVLTLSGKNVEAAASLEHANELYAHKGNIVLTQRTQARLAEVRALSQR